MFMIFRRGHTSKKDLNKKIDTTQARTNYQDISRLVQRLHCRDSAPSGLILYSHALHIFPLSRLENKPEIFGHRWITKTRIECCMGFEYHFTGHKILYAAGFTLFDTFLAIASTPASPYLSKDYGIKSAIASRYRLPRGTILRKSSFLRRSLATLRPWIQRTYLQ
jgi:hypothetical protein